VREGGASAQKTGHDSHLGCRGVGVRRVACKARAVAQGQHAARRVEARAVEVRRGRERHVDVVDAAAAPREVRRNAAAQATGASLQGVEGPAPLPSHTRGLPSPHVPRLGLPDSVRARLGGADRERPG